MSAKHVLAVSTRNEPDPCVGEKIGNCLIERKIGEGGMGVVYLAHHLTLNKKVAVKVLRQDLPKELHASRRFLKEARTAAMLEHPNIVQIHDAGEHHGLAYIVMQYVDGWSLTRRLSSERSLSLTEALRICREVLNGLRYAHEQGVLHRDIKPDNILLGRDGSVRLADFGLARLLEGDPNLSTAGLLMGSPNYMSPEQALGKPLDQRTDLYSLGATLYQMVTGLPPFQGDSAMGVLYRVIRTPVKPPKSINRSVPAALSKYICLLMQKDREARFASAGQALVILNRLVNSERPAKRRAPIGLLALCSILLVVCLVLLAFSLPMESWLKDLFAPPNAAASAAPPPGDTAPSSGRDP